MRVDISMVVICHASDVIEYDKSTPELSIAALQAKKDTKSIEKKKDGPLDLCLDIHTCRYMCLI